MPNKNRKEFFTYEQQIDFLKNKNLIINDEEHAIQSLKEFGYYSLISGYKDIFKVAKHGNYKNNVNFTDLVILYSFDDQLRHIFLQQIIRIEKKIKSLYSYSFCELYGDRQSDYLNVNNYNYERYQDDVNKYIGIINDTITNSSRYPYIKHSIDEHSEVPLWILVQTLTLGTVSKLYTFSQQTLQSKIAREFNGIYDRQLISILNILSKFRNVCAHGERLYNYKTQTSFRTLPIHSKVTDFSVSKNDLFNVLLCFKQLLSKEQFDIFFEILKSQIDFLRKHWSKKYVSQILSEMGFPSAWEVVKDIVI